MYNVWENVLAEMNREEDGLFCDIACGFVYTEKEFDFDELLAWADKLMYEDKKAKKAKNSIREL